MNSVSIGSYTVWSTYTELPNLYAAYRAHARLAEEFDLHDAEGKPCFVGLSLGAEWPMLTVAQRYSAASGFYPSALIVPETELLFLAAGTRLLAYDLHRVERLWEDFTEVGAWGWRRHDEVILLSAELELAAWDIRGPKLWALPVVPPWQYEESHGRVTVDVMGTKQEFALPTGPHTPGGAAV